VPYERFATSDSFATGWAAAPNELEPYWNLEPRFWGAMRPERRRRGRGTKRPVTHESPSGTGAFEPSTAVLSPSSPADSGGPIRPSERRSDRAAVSALGRANQARARRVFIGGFEVRLTARFLLWVWRYPHDGRPRLLSAINAARGEERVCDSPVGGRSTPGPRASHDHLDPAETNLTDVLAGG
jgi:hypothetical protein